MRFSSCFLFVFLHETPQKVPLFSTQKMELHEKCQLHFCVIFLLQANYPQRDVPQLVQIRQPS